MFRFQSINHSVPGRLGSWRCLALFLILVSAGAARAQTGETDSRHSQDHIEVSLISELESIRPGQSFLMAVRLAPEDGWHTYWRNPGDTGLPTRIDWTLPAGGEAGPIQWPPPERIDYQGLINYGYHGETLLLTRITPPANLQPGETYPVRAYVQWLICKDICIPGNATVSTSMTISGGAAGPGQDAGRVAAAREKLPQERNQQSGRFHLTDKLVMALPGATELVGDGDEVQFFPVEPEIMASAEPRIRFRDGRILIQAERHPDYTAPAPEELRGLLVVSSGEDRRAYGITSKTSSVPVDFPETAGAETGGNLFYILVLAFAGGFILNLMPCVFPVLSIKILSLIKSGNYTSRERKLHGFAYTGGILISILAFAGVLLGVRAAGEVVGWGFQLQSPWFVATLVYVFFVMGLALSGLVEIGASLGRTGNLLERFQGLPASFFNGALATVVATPCTVPFMATAVGFAMTRPAPLALLVFAVLGLGLASPFLILAFIPALAERLPRPGRWMETLKQLLAFPLYFTVIWLLWVLERQTGSGVTAMIMTGMVLIAFALWLWRRAPGSNNPVFPRTLAFIAALAALALLPAVITAPGPAAKGAVQTTAGNAYPAVAYSESRIHAALAADRPVFVNINADWCITCKVNERITLKDHRVRSVFEDRNVLYMVGDWTNGDATLSRVLGRFDRSGVPLYLVYLPGKADPQVLPQLLTPATVIEALKG